MVDKTVGDVAAVEGYLEDTIYNVWCIKELDYTMKIMRTASGFIVSDDHKLYHHWF